MQIFTIYLCQWLQHTVTPLSSNSTKSTDSGEMKFVEYIFQNS